MGTLTALAPAVEGGPCTRVLGMGEGPSPPGEGMPFCDSHKAIIWLALALGTGKQYSKHKEGVAGPGQSERMAVVSYPPGAWGALCQLHVHVSTFHYNERISSNSGSSSEPLGICDLSAF